MPGRILTILVTSAQYLTLAALPNGDSKTYPAAQDARGFYEPAHDVSSAPRSYQTFGAQTGYGAPVDSRILKAN